MVFRAQRDRQCLNGMSVGYSSNGADSECVMTSGSYSSNGADSECVMTSGSYMAPTA